MDPNLTKLSSPTGVHQDDPWPEVSGEKVSLGLGPRRFEKNLKMDESSLQPSELGLSFKEELLCEIRNMLAEFTAQIYQHQHQSTSQIKPSEEDNQLLDALLFSSEKLESATREKLMIENETSIIINKLNSSNRKLQQEIDNFAARDQEQKTENAKLLAEIENLKTYISNLPPTEELSELKFHIYASNQIQERLQKSNYLLKKHLQSSLDKSEGLEQKLKAANSELEILKAKIEKAYEQLEFQEKERAKAEELDPNNALSIVSNNDRLTRENTRLNKAMLELERRRDQDCSQLRIYQEQLSRQTETHKKEMEKLLTELEGEKKITSLQRDQVQTRTADLESARQIQSELKRELNLARDAQGATWEIIQNVSKLHGRFSSSITKLKSIVQAEKDLAGGKIPDSQLVLCVSPMQSPAKSKPQRPSIKGQLEDTQRMATEFSTLEDAISELREAISERYCEILVTDLSNDLG